MTAQKDEGVLIRPFLPADTDSVKAVVHQVYDEYGFTWEEDGYHSDLSAIPDHFDHFWVAEWNSKVVGCVGLNLFRLLPGELGQTVLIENKERIAAADCALNRLYLLAECRGKHIGQSLTSTCLQEAKRQGRRTVEIWSDKRFHQAHALYRKFGAIECGERICDDPDQAPEWGMAIPLTE